MKRSFKKSEKILFAACGGLIAFIGLYFVWSEYHSRMAAAREKIETLAPKFSAALAAAGDAPFWKERQGWLDKAMPVMGDSGQAHSSFLEHLQDTAKERGLSLTAPVLLKPEGGPHHHDLSINLQITGPDNAVFHWLADLQSPEKFQLIKYLLLTPATASPPADDGNGHGSPTLQAMRLSLFIAGIVFLTVRLRADEPAIPPPVSAVNYPNLLERAPFRNVLSLSQSLVLSGVAALPDGKVVTVWDRVTGRSFVVTKTPNPQGWKLLELTESTDLRSVAATIAAGDDKLTVRFDPERLIPPKLDNTSKPAPRSEGAVVVEALLRSLHPAAAKEFEALPAEGQEAFRKSFTGFLASYPTASDSKRLAFVQRTLEEMKGGEKDEKKESAPPVPIPTPLPVPSPTSPATPAPVPAKQAPLSPSPSTAPSPQ